MSARVRPAAVARGYNFASTWEQNAALTEEQQAAVAAVAQVFADRPMPAHVLDRHASGDKSCLTDALQQTTLPTEVILLNTHQFYKWYTDLESAMKSEMEEKYKSYVNTLTNHLETCDQILGQVDSTLTLFEDLRGQHHAVAVKTKTLHDACERLVMEKDRLVDFADALRSKLNYFDELENAVTQFYTPAMNVTSGHFLPLLKRLDECISYVGSNPQYADSGVYLLKFRQLQSRALGMVRTHVLSILKSASSQVQAAIKECVAVNGKPVLPEAMETSVLYIRFKAAASEMKPLMEELESRASRKEYTQILSDCHSIYCELRMSIVQGVVHQRISEYSKKELLTSVTRQGCAYLMQMCQLEHQLFDHFFPSSSAEGSNLAPLVQPLCTVLYDILRPKLIHEADLDLLCEVVDIIKVEVLDEQLSRRGESGFGLKPTIFRILADVQERLTFLAQTYMRNEIASYLPSSEDLDYPTKVDHAVWKSGIEGEEGRDTFATWFPPLEKTLSCLSKLYRCLEPAIFTGLAQDSIGMCSMSIQRASKAIAKRSCEMDGQLFLIKNLLILREQIAPFDIEFAVTHKELDFTHLLEHLRQILRGQASFFDFANRSSLARAFSPRILESQVDAKKDLEKSLKSTCEQFIMSITKLAVEPMLSFITKVTAVKLSMNSSTRGRHAELGAPKPLKDQAFAAPEKVAEMVAKVEDALKDALPGVVSKMKYYLQNPATQSILFKPIKSNIIEAYGQITSLINAEYSPEDVSMVRLSKCEDLQAYLDHLC
eukprot:c25792_g1_i1 orf=138-2456(+)